MKGSLVPREKQQGEQLRKVAGDLLVCRGGWGGGGESSYLEKKDKG